MLQFLRIIILVPNEVDSFTGYRYYLESQLPRAGQIQALKGMGFGLAMIGNKQANVVIMAQHTDADS